MKGLGTALITPFTTDGKIDFAALKILVDRQINANVDFLVVLGTTGNDFTNPANMNTASPAPKPR